MVDKARPVAGPGFSAVEADTPPRGLGFGVVSIRQKTQRRQTRPGMSRPGFSLDKRELIAGPVKTLFVGGLERQHKERDRHGQRLHCFALGRPGADSRLAFFFALP